MKTERKRKMTLNRVIRVAEELKRVTEEADSAGIINYFVDSRKRDLFHIYDEKVYRELLASINKEPIVTKLEDHPVFEYEYKIEYMGYVFTFYAEEKL
jgi:hypothetical protein